MVIFSTSKQILLDQVSTFIKAVNCFVVGTPYQGGIFKCKLVVDAEFPQKPPKGYFLTKIYHPNGAVPSGEICVNTLKKDWNPSNWSLSHIFEVIKCLLIVPFPESSLNEEAGREFMENYEGFFKTAQLMTQVHARPTAMQQRIIEQHLSQHFKAGKEEQKSESMCGQFIQQEGQQQQFGGYQSQMTFGKESNVLNQVTNSFVPTQAFEGKGEFMTMGTGQNQNTAMIPQKKTTAAADTKKKWMRRI